MSQADTTRQLTDDELIQLLAPVPLAQQQRDALVRVSLRPGLPVDYAGPVELADLRLSLSPWHWLKHELVVTSTTVALNQLLTEGRVTDNSLDTVAEIATWISDGPFDDQEDDQEERNWESAISQDYYGRNGVVSEHYDSCHGCYLPPLFDLQEVIFLGEGKTLDDIVVTQAEWGEWHPQWAYWEEGKKATGPVNIFALAKRPHCKWWLINADQLWLTDLSTGETYNLDPHGEPAEWEGIERNKAEEEESLEEEDKPEGWVGNPPSLSALPFGLRYEAGQLYRTDTHALLTVSPPHPESVTI